MEPGMHSGAASLQATSFGAVADTYDAGRPSYPADAVAWLTARTPPIVDAVDVGAGTGKLTRGLTELGLAVTAVDPDAAMLVTLRDRTPGARTLTGTGEALPLADATADLITYGQAWHWVDPDVASAEAARVLRPGGVLGLIWNIRDESVPWIAAMGAIMHNSAAEQLIADGGVRVTAPFGTVEHRTWRWARPMTRALLTDMVASRSYVITADPPTRAQIDTELAALFDSLPELSGDGAIDLVYTTHVFRAQLSRQA